MIAYLAHPIDLVGEGPEDPERPDLLALVEDVAADLQSAGFVTYRPAEAFEMPHSKVAPDYRVSQVNEVALRLADVVVVLQPEERTIGTVLELAQAAQSGKPTLVVSEAYGKSWSLAGLEDQYDNVLVADGWNINHTTWLRDTFNSTLWPVGQDLAVMRYKHLTPEVLPAQWGPRRQYSGDAGFDLYVTEDVEIPVGQFKDVPCGIAVQLPPNVWGLIIGRSSTLRKHNLMITPAVIDNGYRGPLYAGAYNMNGEQFSAKKGMRLAQFIPFPLTAAGIDPQWAPELGPSDRGTAGFGSTGE